MRHPWFLSRPIKNDTYYPSPLETASLTLPPRGELEGDIIDSLSLLGWTNKDELTLAIKSADPNPEKVFYNLLHNRKWEMFEHYDADKYSAYDVQGGPRRRTESFSSVGGDRKAFEEALNAATGIDLTKKSSATESDSKRAKSKSEGGDGGSDDHGSTPGHGDGDGKESGQDSAGEISTLDKKAQMMESRPRAASSAGVTTPIVSKKKPLMTISIPGSAADVSAGAANGAAPASPSMTESPRSAAVANAFAAIGLGTPKFHRKMHEAPQTPIITQTPKQSWFTNLFNFKPESFGLVSVKSLEETTTTIQSILTSLDVKFQVRKDGLIKCKYDPNALGGNMTPPHSATPDRQDDAGSMLPPVSHINSIVAASTHDAPNSPAVAGKAVKFKIEISADSVENGRREVFRLQLTQQQGAFSTFQSVVERIQAKWNLEEK
eukprot:jgi/Hompol1/5314/HPOL_004327-RA